MSLLSQIFNGTTEKIGEEVWESLTSTVRRVFGRRSTSVEAAKRLGERPGDPDSIRALAQALVDDSARDAQAAAQLRHWVADAQSTISRVANITTGDISGSAIQSRNIHGGININF